MTRRFALLLLALFVAASAIAETPLEKEIAEQDAAMFAAFNAHDPQALMAFFSEDLEFYHDKDGRLTYEKVREGLTRGLTNNSDLRRDLVPGTLEVFPIPGYGAMEIGAHRFCHTENGKQDCGVFRFAHVWQKKDDRWRVTRVLSYDHK